MELSDSGPAMTSEEATDAISTPTSTLAVDVQRSTALPVADPLDDMSAPLQILRPEQVLALRALVTGNGTVAAARAAGVHRTTITRWVDNDPGFRFALDAWKRHSRDNARIDLLALTDTALANLQQALAGGDKQLSFALLKQLGYFKPAPGGTEPLP